jgi:predicted nuclease of predicted toxin-antitoxin system
MLVKVDEDLPHIAAQWLRERGYEASTVIEQGMGGWKDDALWAAIQIESKFLITADKGFADIRIHPPGSHAGVLLLRPDEDGIHPILRLLSDVLKEMNLSQLEGTIAVATPRSLRVRTP